MSFRLARAISFALAAPLLITPALHAKDVLSVATAYDAKSLDPIATNDVASSNIMCEIYENLVQWNDKNQLVPLLAESFKQINDRTYEFKLRKGIKFHNGEELKARDVKFSLTRAAKAPIVAHIVGDIDIDSFVIPNDYTISFKTKNPITGFLSGLTHSAGSILNEKAVTSAGDSYAMNPVGTGPFKFVSWAKSNSLELARFDGYHGAKPKYSKMLIKVIPEPTNRIIELESGGVDIAYEVSATDLKRVQNDSNMQLLRVLDNSTAYLGFNTSKKPFNDVRVRQAISYAINTKGVVETVWRGIGRPAVGPVAPNVNYSDPSLKVHEYNVAKAKALLKEAGVPSGFSSTIWTNEKKERVDMATIIQSQLKEVGITVDIKVMEWGAYLSGLSKGEQDMFILGWTCQSLDPDMAVYSPFISANKGPGGNYSFFTDAKSDELINKARTMKDGPERKQMYFAIQNRIVEQAPWVFLMNGEQVVGASKSVQGFKPSPFGYHPKANVYFK